MLRQSRESGLASNRSLGSWGDAGRGGMECQRCRQSMARNPGSGQRSDLRLRPFASIEWLRSRHFEQRLNFLRKESEEERRRFLRRLDHELKNPLTSILAGLANLDSDESQVQRMRDLLADLRKLAELETRPIESGRVDLAEILRESREMVLEKPGAGDRRIDLTIPHAPWPLPLVSGDRDLLFLAVHNLVENAVKFTEAGARIELRAYEDGSNAIIEVADTGPGIPDEERALIWEELYRGRRNTGGRFW